MPNKGHPQITVRFSQDELRRLRAAAAAQQVTMAEYVRGCVLADLLRVCSAGGKEIPGQIKIGEVKA